MLCAALKSAEVQQQRREADLEADTEARRKSATRAPGAPKRRSSRSREDHAKSGGSKGCTLCELAMGKPYTSGCTGDHPHSKPSQSGALCFMLVKKQKVRGVADSMGWAGCGMCNHCGKLGTTVVLYSCGVSWHCMDALVHASRTPAQNALFKPLAVHHTLILCPGRPLPRCLKHRPGIA